MAESDAGGNCQEEGRGSAGPNRTGAQAQRRRRPRPRAAAGFEFSARRSAAPMIPLQDDTPSARKAYVTISMIVACCLVFLWQRSFDEAAARRVLAALGAIPAVLLTDARLPPDLEWVRRHASVVTSMFLHGGWLHLLGNMLYLWIYGD